MKVIFLDIDGVLNYTKWYTDERNPGNLYGQEGDLDPLCINRIIRICEETGAKVVISSDWCLINDVDEPQIRPLDMPFKYIIEMLCDWQSAGEHYGNTAYEWYNRQKDKMILSDYTRSIVEKYIDNFKEGKN